MRCRRPSPGAASATRTSGPWSGGSTAVLLTDGAGNEGGAAGETLYARGGPGALADALAAAARSFGVEIRTEAEVASISTVDGRATGVVLTSGEAIEARAVVSGIDARRTLVELVDPVTVGPSMRWRAGNIRQPGVVAKVNLVLAGTPTFPAAEDDPRRLRGRIVVAPGIDAIERAFDAAKYGRPSETPIIEATIPSLVDPQPRRWRTRRDPGHERHRPVRAIPAARRRLGRRSGGARRHGSWRSWSRWRRASAGWSRPARS